MSVPFLTNQKQFTFWEGIVAQNLAIEPRDPHVEEPDKPRLRGQNAAILERLRAGPATNDELAKMSRKYTSRVSDLRKAGYEVECERLGGGLTQYTLVGDSE